MQSVIFLALALSLAAFGGVWSLAQSPDGRPPVNVSAALAVSEWLKFGVVLLILVVKLSCQATPSEWRYSKLAPQTASGSVDEGLSSEADSSAEFFDHAHSSTLTLDSALHADTTSVEAQAIVGAVDWSTLPSWCLLAVLYVAANHATLRLFSTAGDAASITLCLAWSAAPVAVLLTHWYNRDIGALQWASVSVVVIAVIMVRYDALSESMTVLDYGCLLLAVSLTAVLSVWHEQLIRRHAKEPIALLAQHMLFFAMGALINGSLWLAARASAVGQLLSTAPAVKALLTELSTPVILLVVTHALIGLLSIAVYHRCYALVKSFAPAVAAAIILLINAAMFDTHLSLTTTLAVGVAAMAACCVVVTTIRDPDDGGEQSSSSIRNRAVARSWSSSSLAQLSLPAMSKHHSWTSCLWLLVIVSIIVGAGPSSWSAAVSNYGALGTWPSSQRDPSAPSGKSLHVSASAYPEAEFTAHSIYRTLSAVVDYQSERRRLCGTERLAIAMPLFPGHFAVAENYFRSAAVNVVDLDQLQYTIMLSNEHERRDFATLLAPLMNQTATLHIDFLDILSTLRQRNITHGDLFAKGKVPYQGVKKLYAAHAARPWQCLLWMDAEAVVRKPNTSYMEAFVDWFRAPYFLFDQQPNEARLNQVSAALAQLPSTVLPIEDAHFWQVQSWFLERPLFDAYWAHLTAKAGSPLAATLSTPFDHHQAFPDMAYFQWCYSQRHTLAQHYAFPFIRDLLTTVLSPTDYWRARGAHKFGAFFESYHWIDDGIVDGIIKIANQYKFHFYRFEGVEMHRQCAFAYLLQQVPTMTIQACSDHPLPQCDLDDYSRKKRDKENNTRVASGK